jgi:hypothetical protein
MIHNLLTLLLFCSFGASSSIRSQKYISNDLTTTNFTKTVKTVPVHHHDRRNCHHMPLRQEHGQDYRRPDGSMCLSLLRMPQDDARYVIIQTICYVCMMAPHFHSSNSCSTLSYYFFSQDVLLKASFSPPGLFKLKLELPYLPRNARI